MNIGFKVSNLSQIVFKSKGKIWEYEVSKLIIIHSLISFNFKLKFILKCVYSYVECLYNENQ
jgi:hypothetical protein